MPILVTTKQLTLKKLTESLLTARASRTQVAEAVEAVRLANPGLAEGRLPAGTPVVVPPLKNARVDVSAVGKRVGEDLTDPAGAVEQLEPFAAANRDVVGHRVDELASELAQLTGTRGSPLPKETAAALAKALREDVERADTLLTSWSDAVPGWSDRIAELQKLAIGTERA